MQRIALVIVTTMLCCLGAFSNEICQDSVIVYFRVAKHDLDPDYMGNKVHLDRIGETMAELKASSIDIDSILITAYASPEGSAKFNADLSIRRLKSIRNYIVENLGISDQLIKDAGNGVAWDDLRRAVAETSGVPSRDKVINILDNTPLLVYNSSGKIVDSRKRQLMNLDRGTTYRWLLQNIFPHLRNSAAIIVYTKPQPTESVVDTAIAETDTTQHVESDIAEDIVSQPEIDQTDDADDHTPIHRFALKTNFIYDAIMMPSLEFEWRINDKFSAAVEANVAWWHRRSEHRFYQIATIIPEGRYWFKTRAPWRGMYVGVFAGGGKYDLENRKTGYKGEGGLAGISFGYMWQISRNLSLEAATGVGYMYTRLEEYKPIDTHYVYQRTRNIGYFGPMKLKFALAWRFYDITRKKKGGQSER